MTANGATITPHRIPDEGQLVTVRQRRYIVTHVVPGHLPPQLFAGGALLRPQHLVRLQSIDDEGLADEISVIWDIESGIRIHERAALPDPTRGFDPARRLDVIRWGAVASADVRTLRAPFRSGVTIDDYQLDPVAQVPERMVAKSRITKRG